MTTSILDLKNFFESELKRKISEKAKNPVAEYKILLNCFKFYDVNNSGEIDKTNWIFGIFKTGITGFNENEMDLLYNSYLTNYSNKLDYKDFCNYIYGRERTDPLSKSLKNNNNNMDNILNNANDYLNNNSSIKNYLYNTIPTTDFNQYNIKTNNQINSDYSSLNTKGSDDNEYLINKMKEIIHTNNGVNFYSFMKFLKINEDATSHKLSLEDLSVTIQELHIDMSSNEIHQLFNYLDSEKSGRIYTSNLIKIIKGTLDNKRKKIINDIFGNIDTEKKDEIFVNRLKNLYNAKNHPDVLDGIKTEEEIYNQFCYTIDVYIRINQILNNIITKDQFVDYYSGISPSIQDDDIFKKTLEKVWASDKNKYKNKSGYNIYNYDNNNGDNDIGINSIFLGVSHTKRPKYDYNYDYLEEFSKSSPNISDNKNYTNGKKDKKYNYNNNANIAQNSARNAYVRNIDLNSFGGSILNKTSGYKNNIIDNYNNNNSNVKSLNQSVNLSNSHPLGNSTSDTFFTNESKKTIDNKGIKVFKTKRYNPITDEYFKDDVNDMIINNNNKNNSNNNNLDIQKQFEKLNNNSYNNKNLYYGLNDSAKNNNNINKKEIELPQKEENDNEIINEDVEEEKNINYMNLYQNDNLKENESLIQFRKLLISRGAKSIFRFQRMLSIYDRNHSGLISFDNFYTIFQAYYINIPLTDIKAIFALFDTTKINNKNNNDNYSNDEMYMDPSMFRIKYDDLLKSVIGIMPVKRQLLIKKVYDSFNKDNEGKIMTSEIKTRFNYKKHPDALSGKKAPNEIYSDFLDFLETFREYNDNLKGGYSFSMSFEEFFDFYNEISMTIEDDVFFEIMIRNCWDLDEENNNNDNIVEILKQREKIKKNNDEFNVVKNSTFKLSGNYKGRKNNIYNIIDNGNNINNNDNIKKRNGNSNNDEQNIRIKVGAEIIGNRIF